MWHTHLDTTGHTRHRTAPNITIHVSWPAFNSLKRQMAQNDLPFNHVHTHPNTHNSILVNLEWHDDKSQCHAYQTHLVAGGHSAHGQLHNGHNKYSSVTTLPSTNKLVNFSDHYLPVSMCASPIIHLHYWQGHWFSLWHFYICLQGFCHKGKDLDALQVTFKVLDRILLHTRMPTYKLNKLSGRCISSQLCRAVNRGSIDISRNKWRPLSHMKPSLQTCKLLWNWLLQYHYIWVTYLKVH